MKRQTWTSLTLLAVLAVGCGKDPGASDNAVAAEERAVNREMVTSTANPSPCRDALQGKTLSEVYALIHGGTTAPPAECQAVGQKIQDAVTRMKSRFPNLAKRIGQSDGQLKQTILTQCGSETVGSSALPECVRNVIRNAIKAKIGNH